MLNCIISPPRTDGYFERGDTRPNVSVVLATFLRINVTGQATGKLSIFAGASGSPVIPPAKAFSILDHEENATNTPRSKSRNAHTLAHASAFTRRWGVTARATRERRSRRHCKFHGGLSIRRELVSKAHQSRWWTKHDRARVYTRGGLSIFANFLPSHSIARCLWPTPLIVVARQQSISAHDIRTQPRLRILRVCLFFFYFSFFLSFFFFFFSRFYPLRGYSMIDPLYPIVDSMAVCATCAHELIHSVHMGPVRRDVTAQNCCLANYVFIFF